MPTADAQQLRALVGAIRRGSEERRLAVAVRAEPLWTGPAVLDGDVPLAVAACGSPLAVRAALASHEYGDRDEVLVMLTSCTDGDLGPDLTARLAKGRVVSLDPFAAVLSLFRATVLDPTLVRDARWLVDDLIELAPAGGWPNERLVANVLDADTAWRVWHRERLHIVEPEALADALALGEAPGLAALLGALTAEQRRAVAQRWAGGAAPITVVVDLLAGGHGGELVPLGLVAGVLWATTDDAARAQEQTIGRIRLEGLLGRDALDERSARVWSDVAAETLDDGGAGSLWCDRAEQTLRDGGVPGLAELSDHLPSGFELRADALAAHLAAGRVSDAEAALDALRRHRHGVRRARRLAAATAAVRLLRRPPVLPVTTLRAQVRSYLDDGAWVEEARRLIADGDQRPTLQAAFATLHATIVDEQRRADQAFARRLAEWSASEPMPDPSIVPVEQLLDRVAVPVAKAVPVLVLVCDGMAVPVANELLRDIAEAGWAPAVPVGADPWPAGVAMLPTVTEVSRASLLCGERVECVQSVEREGFANHPGLRAASGGRKAPVLFHKSQLVGPAGTALSDHVRAAIADPAHRVVGIVVNSVDDHLSRGDQVRVDWTLEALGPLPWILDAAAEGGRAVVLTADHGHVLHGEGATMRQHAGGGERWRPAGTVVAEDEVEVHGPRVLKGGRAVLAVDDRLRYAGFKHGYHGGATLREVIVPVTVLTRQLPAGWERRPLVPPAWWASETHPGVDVAAAPPSAPVVEPSRPSRRTPAWQAALFDAEPGAAPVLAPAGPADWVGALLATPTIAAQRGRLPRPVADERVAAYMSALHANGGSIPLTSLATRVGEPADELRMTLTAVQRLLNLDGSEILTVRSGTVELNVELLRLQFGVDVP